MPTKQSNPVMLESQLQAVEQELDLYRSKLREGQAAIASIAD